MAAKTKQPQRNPNVPVLVFACGDTIHEILIAGPGEFIDMRHKSHGRWSDNGIIERQWSHGLKETEGYIHSRATWGWLGRLIGETPEGTVILSPTDADLCQNQYDIAGRLAKLPEHLREFAAEIMSGIREEMERTSRPEPCQKAALNRHPR